MNMLERNRKLLEPFTVTDESGTAYRRFVNGEISLDDYRCAKRSAISKYYFEISGD